VTMRHVMCMQRYERSKTTGNKHDVDLMCQYVQGHVPVGIHSWSEVLTEDERLVEQEMAARLPASVTVQGATMDEVVTDVLKDVDAGLYDPYIEALLSALHDRKRTLRGVRLFPRRDRRG
jgi:hypothetical protein